MPFLSMRPIKGDGVVEHRTTNVLFVGVGGQGIILASEVLAMLCLEMGCDVKQGEVHGMAQRGGSVVSHVRFGSRVYSPMIELGQADFIVSFELLESLRWMGYLKPDGAALVNALKIAPITVATGAAKYPPDIEERILEKCKKTVFLDGLAIAEQAGNARAVNVAILGGLSTCLPFEQDAWELCIRKRVPERFLNANLSAFRAGRQASEVARAAWA